MHTPFSPRRDFGGMEQRRNRAGRLFAAGKLILAAIARELRVSRQSVSRWYRDWRRGGAGALRGAGRAGRKPKLNAKQLPQIAKELRRDRKSTRLNSSHTVISYAVFCLKKKKRRNKA